MRGEAPKYIVSTWAGVGDRQRRVLRTAIRLLASDHRMWWGADYGDHSGLWINMHP